MNMDKRDLVDFIIENKLMTYSAGVVIGLVSKDVILSLVQDIIIPIFFIIFIRLKFNTFTKILPRKDKMVNLNITNFIGCLITWILALFCTFLFVQYIFIHVLGIKSNPVTKSNTEIVQADADVEPEGYR